MNYLPSSRRIKIAAAGGGGGLPRAVKGLMHAMPQAEIDGIVTVGDGGSKTGEARKVFKTVAMGDTWKTIRAASSNGAGDIMKIRFDPNATADDFRCLNERMLGIVATTGSNSDKAAASLEETARRTKELPNGLGGHTYGGLVLTGLTLDHGNNAVKGAQVLSKWAGVPKRVRIIPVTNDIHDVVMYDQEIIYGEDEVDKRDVKDPKNARVWLQRNKRDERPPAMSQEAYGGAATSDIFLNMAGSFWSTVLAAMTVRGMVGALEKQRAHGGKLVVVGNLVQERNATTGLDMADYVAKLQGLTGPDMDQPITGRSFDYVIYNNNTAEIPKCKVPIYCDIAKISALGAQALGENLVEISQGYIDPHDPIGHMRSEADGIGHNMWNVANILEGRVLTHREPAYV